MNIALIAHDNKKQGLIEWAEKHRERLTKHSLFATASTGGMLEEAGFNNVQKFKHGPLGGDQQIGALIAEGQIQALIFFWDPLSSQPHDVDVKALLRIGVVYDIPVVCNQASANLLVAHL